MLARRLATILPALSLAEALQTSRIHRVACLTSGRTAVVTTRPFQTPHHTIAAVGVIGASPWPMPGEVSLAPHGMLCLDERPACTHHGFEVLRQSLEKNVTKIQSLGRPRPDSASGVSGAAVPVHRRSELTGGRDDRESRSCQAVYQARPHP